MIILRNIVLVLQKNKQAKTRVDLNGKRVRTYFRIVFLSGIRTLNIGVAVRRLFSEQSFLRLTTFCLIERLANSCPSSLTTVWLNKEQNHSLEQKLNSVRIYLLWQFLQCRPRLMLAYFYEIQMPFPETASKTLSHIQSTAKYILLRETLLLILTPLATL